MYRYLLNRLAQSILVIWGVCTIVFVLMRMGGDPVQSLLPPNASDQQIDALRQQLGLDRPLLEQYAIYMAQLAQGDFGVSPRHREPVLKLLVERIPATLDLTLGSLVVSLAVALPLGTLSALKRDTPIDTFSSVVALIGQCLPTFWLGIILVLVFAVQFGIFPALGAGTPLHLVLPSISLGAYSAALMTRVIRSSLLEVLSEDYVRTARAKGLSEYVVLLRHVARGAAIPVITIIAIQIGHLLSGAIVTETVFSYPGMGLLVIQAIYARDYMLVQAFVIMLALVIVVVNLGVDFMYTWLDPRARLA